MEFKNKFEQTPAVVVGLCGHGLSIVRALAKNGVPVIALEANSELPGFYTKLAHVHHVIDINGEPLIQSLIELREKIIFQGCPVLFLTNDRMIKTVAIFWGRLEGLYRLSWAHCRENLLPLLEKSNLERRAGLINLAYPKSYVLESKYDGQAAINEIGLPIFVKPVRPLAKFKTAQPANLEELTQLADSYANDLPFLIQQFIPGDDTAIYFCALYLDHGKIVARFDGHKLRSRPLGHTTIAESFPSDEVYILTCKFFEGLELSGPVSLELKRDNDGKYWIIEPTVGRTDFWVDVCVQNGVNLPFVEYEIEVGLTVLKLKQYNSKIWFNEERDPFGIFWFILNRYLSWSGRRPAFLFLHRIDLKPALLSVNKIFNGLSQSIIKRLFFFKYLSSSNSQLSDGLFVKYYDLSGNLPIAIHDTMKGEEALDVEFGLDWLRNLADSVFDNNDTKLCVLYRQGKVCVIIPIHVIRRKLFNKVETLGNFYTALYQPFCSQDVSIDEISFLIKAIQSDFRPVAEFRFFSMNKNSKAYSLLHEGMRAAGLSAFKFFCFGNWFLPVVSSWDSYFSTRSGELKNTIVRMSKRFQNAGGYFEVLQNVSELDRGLNAYYKVYAASWKNPEPYSQFIGSMCNIYARRGQLRIGLAWLGDEAIAAQLWIVANRKANIYKLAFDDRYSKYSPGTLLSAFMLKSTIDVDNVSEVDYLIGDDAYKKSWMSHRRERWGIVAYNPATLPGIFFMAREIIGRFVRRFSKA